MAKAKKKTAKSAVKKAWFQIVTPTAFNNQIIGETPVVEPSKTIGKKVAANLMNLTGDMRKQNINIIFEITSLSGSKYHTEVQGFQMIASSIKRMVRRGKRKIDYSFTIKTADNYKLQLKIIMVTLGLTNASVLTRLRAACKEEVDKYMEKAQYDYFVNEIVGHRFQTNMKRLLNKTHPLKMFEVRTMKVMDKSKVEVKKAAPKVEEKTEASKVEEKKEAPKVEEKTEVKESAKTDN